MSMLYRSNSIYAKHSFAARYRNNYDSFKMPHDLSLPRTYLFKMTNIGTAILETTNTNEERSHTGSATLWRSLEERNLPGFLCFTAFLILLIFVLPAVKIVSLLKVVSEEHLSHLTKSLALLLNLSSFENTKHFD